MKKLYTINEAVYTQTPEVTDDVQKLNEQVAPVENKINVLVNEVKLNEDCGKMNVKINKEEFKSLFGPKSKPRKGDFLSLTNAQKKYKIKSAKKFSAKKAGKGYKVSLKKVE